MPRTATDRFGFCGTIYKDEGPATPRPRAAGAWLVIALALCLLLGSGPAPAAEAPELLLHGDEQSIRLQPYLSQLRDPGGQLRIEQVLDGGPSFSHDGQGDLNFGYTRDAVWLRLQLRSAAPQVSEWRLEFSYSSLDLVEYFEPDADGVRRQRGGDTLPFAARSISHRNPVFALRLEPGEQRTLYLRAQSEGSLTLDAGLWRADAFQRHSEAGYALLALYFGMLLALAAYNLLLYSALRAPCLAFYVLFVLCFAAGVLSINGFGPQYFWPRALPWANYTLPLGMTLAAAASALFTRAFLDTAVQAPRWHRVLGLSALLELAAGAVLPLLSVQSALQLMSLVGILHTLLLLSCGIACLAQRVPGAPIFVLAWGMMLLGGGLLALRNFGALPSNFFTVYAMQIGSALEMLLLSFALAARFNQLKRQKEQAQQQMLDGLQEQERILEQRVAERTEALAAANARLREQALKDPLTGLANRTALEQQLDAVLARTRRRQDRMALMLLDLDGFKAINDQLGHEAGDQLLQRVAQCLLARARKSDLVARLGGDEFVLICEEIHDHQHGLALAERFLDGLTLPAPLQGHAQALGASIGVTLSDGENTDSSTLLRQADQAMYAAKAGGRNRIRLFGATSEPAFGRSAGTLGLPESG